MAEERISHLEPIEKEPVSIMSEPEKMKAGMTEMSVSPESGAEEKKDTKSESEAMYQKMLAVSPQQAVRTDTDVNADAEKVSLKMDADSKVTQLVDLAVAKGVVHAVKVARRLNDFYILDQLHDDLANRLYASLKEKGLISE